MKMLKAIVWNMQQKSRNWEVLREWPELRNTDVALLCEAPPVPPDVQGIGHGSTKGLDCSCPGPDCKIRTWSTVIASRHPLDPEIPGARVDRHYGKPLPFEPSRPGTWTAALVDVDGVTVTAISLYGLMDEKSDASIHRSLSELSPIFDHKEYGKRLVLGGNLNILAGRPVGVHLDRHQVVLARIRAYGLVDCLEKALRKGLPPRARLENCLCRLGKDCTHT